MRNIRAVITASVGAKGYRQLPVGRRIESYTIDTAMDTDADAFSIDLGMPDNDLAFLLRRDTEVRVALFTGVHPKSGVKYLQTGIADLVEFDTEDHILSISGRDLSCIATDSAAKPQEIKHLRPHVHVKKRARAMGIGETDLAQVSALGRYYTDGSESEWETWWRLYRMKKMYIWLNSQGRLIADKPAYSVSPRYFLGKPPPSANNKSRWFPILNLRVLKNTQNRVGEVWIFGERNDMGFVAKAKDASIKSWKRKPLKIINSADARSQQDARKEAFEEIYEGKVGALELIVTIRDEGRLLRQNTMCRLRVPDAGINGQFYIVGVRYMGSSAGYIQEVRLREKNFALTKRVPDAPELIKDPTEDAIGVGGELNLAGVRWGDAFVSAAREFHDGWDLKLFLGICLAICDHETGFRNVRYGGTQEWFPPRGGGGREGGGEAYERHRRLFANARMNPLNPLYPRSEAAVGPMQLVTPDFKVWADQYGGRRDEYTGGRWMPSANIRAGVRAFKGKLSRAGDPKRNANIYIGVEHYYGHPSAAERARYVNDIRRRYENKFKEAVEEAFAAATVIRPGESTRVTVRDDRGQPFSIFIPDHAPPRVKRAVNFVIRQLGKPYLWGGHGPNAFDCSGLVIEAFWYAGVRGNPLIGPNHNSYTRTLFSGFPKVSKDRLLPGDMVFFRGLGHMGMFVGNGHMIHAPKTGDVVKVSAINTSYYRSVYEGAARVVPWDGRGVDRGD